MTERGRDTEMESGGDVCVCGGGGRETVLRYLYVIYWTEFKKCITEETEGEATELQTERSEMSRCVTERKGGLG